MESESYLKRQGKHTYQKEHIGNLDMEGFSRGASSLDRKRLEYFFEFIHTFTTTILLMTS